MMVVLKFQLFLNLVFLFFISGCSLFSSSPTPIVDELITYPSINGHHAFIKAINDAKKSIHLKMYHLTDEDVTSALIDAKKRNIELKIILDNESLNDQKYLKAFNTLKGLGIDIRKSSTCFSLTHEKSMTVDLKSTFITSINLTRTSAETRDFGVITSNKEIIKEVDDVFIADWNNSTSNTCTTPPLNSNFLIWSPVNAETKLLTLIRSAHETLEMTVENLGNAKVEQALTEMASRGIEIKLIVPQCDKNKNPFYNYPFIKILSRGNIQVRVMPHPSSVQYPYMHSKMILVDRSLAYVGSINFSNNSMLKARELGVVFNDEDAISKITKEFDRDWNVSIVPVTLKKDFCPEI